MRNVTVRVVPMAARVIERIELAIEVSTGPGRDACHTLAAFSRTNNGAGLNDLFIHGRAEPCPSPQLRLFSRD